MPGPIRPPAPSSPGTTTLPPELIFGRKRCCWAALPKAMITGATILVPKGISRGAPASADSSSKIYCCTEFQPGPPNSMGQLMPPQPRSCSRRCHMHVVRPAQLPAVQDLFAYLRRQLFLEEGAHFLAEGLLFLGKF